MRKALTAKTIDALKPQAKRYEVHDALCPGFSVRVSPQGQKTFNVKYRYGIRQRRLKLGIYPRVSLSEARERAMAALRQVDELSRRKHVYCALTDRDAADVMPLQHIHIVDTPAAMVEIAPSTAIEPINN